MCRWILAFCFYCLLCALPVTGMGGNLLQMELRYQVMHNAGDDYQLASRKEEWSANRTAVIVCDVWDYHHCYNAVKRLEQFAPRLNEVVVEARKRGCIVIHAPSDCMDAYKDHPARLRAQSTPPAKTLPEDIGQWCKQIPSEEKVVYPIDQTDGGEDDDPAEHAKWAKHLEELGRDPRRPWREQLSTVVIDPEKDYVTDRGEEVWSILEANGIENVILTGVHVNMCVLGRPFGLRQLSKNGKNVVLMRDMTDSMYNPKQWPYVTHHEGTRRIISHIERHVCPTVTSDQLIGGKRFEWPDDKDSN